MIGSPLSPLQASPLGEAFCEFGASPQGGSEGGSFPIRFSKLLFKFFIVIIQKVFKFNIKNVCACATVGEPCGILTGFVELHV